MVQLHRSLIADMLPHYYPLWSLVSMGNIVLPPKLVFATSVGTPYVLWLGQMIYMYDG